MIYEQSRSGKCIMQEIKWQNLKCQRCGAEMPKEPVIDNNGNEIKTCKNCGLKVMLLRNIGKELQE